VRIADHVQNGGTAQTGDARAMLDERSSDPVLPELRLDE